MQWSDVVFPKYLTEAQGIELEGVLYQEGLMVTRLLWSVSGDVNGELLVAVFGECRDVETGVVVKFKAVWRVDYTDKSDPAGQYYLADVEIQE